MYPVDLMGEAPFDEIDVILSPAGREQLAHTKAAREHLMGKARPKRTGPDPDRMVRVRWAGQKAWATYHRRFLVALPPSPQTNPPLAPGVLSGAVPPDGRV